ncbi:MAG TPA: O-acetyl-ADP-ribose deacetylase [Pyrinomonadaceae bacterium]|nr:O-acetyl-ADP-ribose deacetylase [Pyrinomonadaceae bacterium]
MNEPALRARTQNQKTEYLNGRVLLLVGDITVQAVDAIVNAANPSLLGGGGVDGAIHRSGGPEILADCRDIRYSKYPAGLPTGEAVITRAGNLPARHVIHTVGPIYGKHGGREAELLTACYQNSLMLATRYHLTSIAFPAISTGVYGYPRDEAGMVASRTIERFLSNDRRLKEVRMVFFKLSDMDIFIENQTFGRLHEGDPFTTI